MEKLKTDQPSVRNLANKIPIIALNVQHGDKREVVRLSPGRFTSYTKAKLEKCVLASTSTALSLNMRVEDKAYEAGHKVLVKANKAWA